MKLSLRIAATAISLLTMLRAGDEPLPEVLPPNAKVVMGLKVQALAAALEANGFVPQMQEAETALAKQLTIPGFNPLRDVDEVLIASESEGQNAPTLIVLHGQFAALADAPPPNPGKDTTFALLDSETALIGPAAMVQAALGRRGSGSALPAKLAAEIAPLRERYDFWGVGERSAQAVAAAAKAKPGAAATPGQSIDRFAFGASLSHGLDATAEFHDAVPKEAEQMQKWMELFEAAIRNGRKSDSAARFDVKSARGNFKISISIPEEEWKKAMEQQRPVLTQALAGRFGLKAPAPAPTPQRIVTDDRGNTVSLTLPGKQ